MVTNSNQRVADVFVHDPRKPVLSTLEDLVPGASWRRVVGPGSAQAMRDFVGNHFVRGAEPCPGTRGDLDEGQGLLAARRLLAGDGSRPQDVEDVQLVQLWAGNGRVSGAVAALGGRAVRVGYAHGQDFCRPADRRAVDGLLDRAEPATVLAAPQCRDWSSWQDVNVSRLDGFACLLRFRRLRQLVVLRWMCRVLISQLRRGGDIIVEQPRRSKMWRLSCIRRLVRLAREEGFDLDFIDLDQCVFGLCDPVTRRRFKKSTRFLVSRPSRYSGLARKCCCRGSHQPLAGSTQFLGRTVRRTRLAECYPRKLARGLASVIVG